MQLFHVFEFFRPLVGVCFCWILLRLLFATSYSHHFPYMLCSAAATATYSTLSTNGHSIVLPPPPVSVLAVPPAPLLLPLLTQLSTSPSSSLTSLPPFRSLVSSSSSPSVLSSSPSSTARSYLTYLAISEAPSPLRLFLTMFTIPLDIVLSPLYVILTYVTFITLFLKLLLPLIWLPSLWPARRRLVASPQLPALTTTTSRK
eukprot:GHVS01007499.1.p1 GENE.GHVS01007499.1~~GHVS01007499.1.p1  ORF type:complete len:202 (+),score=40.63 GHVS01007499.1:27-632(+)